MPPPTTLEDRLADLTSTLAGMVCDALANRAAGRPTEDDREVSSGYFAGTLVGGCVTKEEGKLLALVLLSHDHCMENLLLGTCSATLGELYSCVDYFSYTDPVSFSCEDARTVCTPFENHGGCDQTVIQNHFQYGAPDSSAPIAPPSFDCDSLPVRNDAVPPFCGTIL